MSTEPVSDARATAATPLARSAARQLERELAAPADAGGKVTLRDVVASRPPMHPPALPRIAPGATGAVARAMARQGGECTAPALTAEREPAVTAPPPAATLDLARGFPPSQRTPLSSMRRVIASRLAASKRDAPHYYMSADCVADPLLQMRAALNATLPESERLSVNDLILSLTARCLARHRALNAAWDGDALVSFEHVNLAVAVAVDGGLVTPVLRNAGALYLREIRSQVQALLDAARRRALPREAFEGGTFTVSNLGMYPVSQFAAIVNPPQAAILAVAAAQRRVVPLDDDRTAVRRVMTVTLSVDHRVADGVAGAAFLADFKAMVEEPRRALL